MPAPALRFRVSENVGARRVGEEVFILAPDGDLVILGNETAVFLWEAVEAGAASVENLAARLGDEYAVSQEQATLDADEFVHILMERVVLLAIA